MLPNRVTIEKTRVLFSCRDPGGAGHILALYRAFRENGQFDVDLAASGIALAMLRKEGEVPCIFECADGRDHLQLGEDATPLLDAARQLLAESRPHAVFVALSSFGIGIDEALLATCQVPSFAMQDFWGDVNLGLNRAAGLYFVLDDEADDLTRERWAVPTVPVGSPKHARYASIDVLALRHACRELLGISEDRRVIGFLNESLEIPGQEAAFRSMVDSSAQIKQGPLFVFREHPKFVMAREAHLSYMRSAGLEVVDATDKWNAEMVLAACDVITTTFSSCGLDHAYLSAYSRAPIGSVVYLMVNKAIRSYFHRTTGLWRFPIVNKGMGRVIEKPGDIVAGLSNALSYESKVAYFEACASLKTDDPCRSIIDRVAQCLSVGRPS